MKDYIKRLREEAANALEQGRAIMGDIRDSKIAEDQIDEKTQQAEAFFDEAEQKAERARALEKSEKLHGELTAPTTELPLGGSQGKVEDFSPEKKISLLSPESKALALAYGYDEKQVAATRVMRDERSFDDEFKTRVGVALLWKYGAQNFEQGLARLPNELQKIGSELKALATLPGGAGGFLVADTHRVMLIELIAEQIAMRRISNVLPPIAGGSSITPSEESELSDPTWTVEISTGTADTVEPFGERALTPHPLAKRILVSRTVLRAATLQDVELYVLRRLARRFSYAEENGFVNGNGAQQPIGLLNAGIAQVTSVTSSQIYGDDIIEWAYTLPAGYSQRARIVCNRSFVKMVRKLHTFSSGVEAQTYLWSPGLGPGQPPSILDWPYEISDAYNDAASGGTWDAGEVAATIGDFDYYWIVDSLNFEVQRLDELYAETNQVGFIGRKETDGMVVVTDAFRELKVKS